MASGLRPDLEAGVSQLVACIHSAGGTYAITSGYRTEKQQARLYRRAQAGLSRYPAAPPGRSAHQEGRAVDIVITPAQVKQYAGRLWQSWGGLWGGAQDDIHFEVYRDRTLQIRGLDACRGGAIATPGASPVVKAPVLPVPGVNHLSAGASECRCSGRCCHNCSCR